MAKGRTDIDAVWITEARVATALGDLGQTWDGLLQGKTAIREVSQFDTSDLPCNLAASIDKLRASINGASRLHPILDEILAEPLTFSKDPSVITATIKAGIDNLEAISRGKTADAGDILPSRLPAVVAKKLGIEARAGFNVNAACASGTIAIARAASMIRSGICDCAVVCCVEPLSLFIFSGFASLRILSPQPCRPFDKDRDGLTIGEGAAVFVLMRDRLAREMGRPCIGMIRGWGMTNDAEQIITPAHDARGLIAAIRNALACASIGPGDVGAIGAHGTGTIFNDAAELYAIHEIFGADGPPVYSVKGALGHTMGAAGGIEAAIALKALSMGAAPPTVGLKNKEQNCHVRVVAEPTSFEGSRMLTMNSGFGGVNCALVIEASGG
jgi:3-oxoacyl-[acyl-carrier-protein] synthase II